MLRRRERDSGYCARSDPRSPTVPFRTSGFARAFFVFCLASLTARLALANPDDASARVVLIGEAGRSTALNAVLRELLEREHVSPVFEQKPHFRTSALLETSSQDARVWVFIAPEGSKGARLYFRGPFGNRFLLRRLKLKNGLDEVGRELIAQVVETSILTLLRSEVGLSREQVEAGITDASGSFDESLTYESAEPGPAAPEPAPAPASSPAPAPLVDEAPASRSLLELLLAARGAAKWTGSDLGLDHGIGGEAGLSVHFSGALFARGRVVFEYGFGQTITTPVLSANIRSSALRAGVDFGSVFGSSTFAFGLGIGFDRTRIAPEAGFDPSLALAETKHASIPVLRLEARYELARGVFRASAGVFGDVSLVDTHYDVQRGSTRERIAEPWPVRPGLFLSLGICPSL
jgi:hypothetical protein